MKDYRVHNICSSRKNCSIFNICCSRSSRSSRSRRKMRNRSGSALVLILTIMAPVFFVFGMCLNQYGLSFCKHARYQSVVEAASLVAASDLSKIVVNDANWGYISLSNYPPIGRATRAADGEPTPVLSINNIIGTTRLDAIIADQLTDQNISALSKADVGTGRQAADLLQKSLQAAVDPSSHVVLLDKDGNAVHLLDDVKSSIMTSMNCSGKEGKDAGSLVVHNIKVSIGHLRGGGTTNVRVPNPLNLAKLSNNLIESGKYRSGVNIPYGTESFNFADTNKAAALANVRQFLPADNQTFSSVVRVEADFTMTAPGQFMPTCFHIASCAVPYELDEQGPSGALMASFPCGLVKHINSLSDLLHTDDGDGASNEEFYKAVNGDYPVDKQAQTAPATLSPWGSTVLPSQAFAAGIFCWLRGAHTRPRIDLFIAALRNPLPQCEPGSNLVYEFNLAGEVRNGTLPGLPSNSPLPMSYLSEQQPFCQATYSDYTVACYNNVCTTGTALGGKHSGLPVEGDPINWCDLACFDSNAQTAKQLGKGELGSGLTARGSEFLTPENVLVPGGIANADVQFSARGWPVQTVPRKSYYSGGLAVQFCISTM